MRAYLADMVSPEKKKQMVEEKSWRPPKRTFDEKKVFALSETINANHDKFEAWRNRVLEHASIFTITEIQVIVTLKKDIKPLSDERYFPWAFLSSIFEIIALRMALTVTKR